MTGCLDDGALQAYLDSELPEAKLYLAAGHLQSCAACRARLERVEATATRVNALLDFLVGEVPDFIPPLAVARFGARPGCSSRVRWAVAAALAVLFLSRADPGNGPAPPSVLVPAQVASPRGSRSAGACCREPGMPAGVKPKAARVRRPNAVPAPAGFLALDNADPIQVGMVVRVMLPASAFAAAVPTGEAQAVMADLVIGEDGRARAIRFVQ